MNIYKRNRWYQQNGKHLKKYIVGLGISLALLFVFFLIGWKTASVPVITIRVNKITKYRGEDIGTISANITCDGDTSIILDSQQKYTIQDLVLDLQNGTGYTLETNADMNKEGTYPVKVNLDEELKTKFQNDWCVHVRCEIIDGTIEVRNEFGTWEGTRFKKYDGTYAQNEFISSNGNDYYFDENGELVRGEYTICGKVYYFSEKGVFDTEKNMIHPGKPMIALTFDDGPGNNTDQLLEKLEACDARATFFVLGNSVKEHPETIQKMHQIGCEIGNHTNDHKNLTKLKPEEMKQQIDATTAEVRKIIGENTKFVRPPYGAVDSSVKKTIQEPFIFWSVDTLDWERQNADEIVAYVLKQVKDGDIVLMHDIHSYSVTAAIQLVDELQARGYQLVTVSEMAEVRGARLQNSEKYFQFYK